MTSVVGFVPSKLNSQRLPRKNVLPLGGRPLVNWVLGTLDMAKVDESVIYAADDEITRFVEPDIDYRFVQRPAWLDTDEAKVQDFVGSFLDDVEGDVVVLLHITSPFITPATVDACVDAVVSGEHESAFAALEMQRFAWFRGEPLNYRLDLPTPRTQDLDPVLVEQSGLYVFTRDLFRRTGRRIADRPYIHPIDPLEGHDIDTAEEFELAEMIASLRSEAAG
jgi:CMP-N-acetylneuraminic acid synthetase